MSPSKQSRGKCGYCSREFAKGGMLRHLSSCRQRKETIAVSGQTRDSRVGLVHLRVSDAWNSDFWLDLEMEGSATLRDLDPISAIRLAGVLRTPEHVHYGRLGRG